MRVESENAVKAGFDLHSVLDPGRGAPPEMRPGLEEPNGAAGARQAEGGGKPGEPSTDDNDFAHRIFGPFADTPSTCLARGPGRRP
jgi:hypothetical protein